MTRLFDKLKLMFAGQPSSQPPVISGTFSFKEQMVTDIIPLLKKMIKKEKDHLYWLESKKAPKEMIESSKYHLNHLRQRHREYVLYAEGLS